MKGKHESLPTLHKGDLKMESFTKIKESISIGEQE
jgi:hypothetical protein